MRPSKYDIAGDVEVDLMEDIIKELPKLTALHSEDHSILLHGLGGQTKYFFRELKKIESVEVLWTGWSDNVWWTYLLSFIPGQAGLIKVVDRKKLDEIYLDLGANIMCGLYFIPNRKVQPILDRTRKERISSVRDILDDETNYFLLTVDFGYHGGDRDGEIFYRHVIIGEDLDEELRRTLERKK